MAKNQRVPRLKVIPHTLTVVGASGEYSDFQKICEILEQKALAESHTSLMDSLYHTPAMSPSSTWNYLRMLMYQRRNKMNPLWNDLVVAGVEGKDRKPFLGLVDKIGTTLQDNFVATGFGSYLAMPLLREKWHPDMTEGEARALLEDCMKVLFYRDGRASNTIQLAKMDNTEVLVSEPYELETSWDAQAFINPVADIDGDGGW